MSKKIIEIDQNIDFLSDQLTLTSPYLSDFINEKESYTVKHGYSGKEITAYGVADKWTIKKTKNNLEVTILCRDKMKDALSTYFQKTYIYDPTPTGLDRFFPLTTMKVSPITTQGSGEGGGAGVSQPSIVVANRELPYSTGEIMASTVAKDACETAGLGLAWECTDYPVVNEVEKTAGFSGSVADVLKKLVEPLQHTEMFRVDIFIKSDVVIVKKRRYPYVVDTTLSLDDSRIKEFSLTKINYNPPHPDGSIGETPVRDIYMVQESAGTPEEDDDETKEDDEDEDDGGGGGGSSSGGSHGWMNATRVEETILETKDPDTDEVLTRQIKRTYYINEIVIREEELTYKRFEEGEGPLVLAQDTTIIFQYAGASPLSDYQKLEKKVTTTYLYEEDNESGAWGSTYLAKLIISIVTYSYSGNDEIIVEDTFTQAKSFDLQGSLLYDENGDPIVTTTQETVTNEKITKDLIRITTLNYTNGTFTDKKELTTSGQLPGPKRVGVPVNTTKDDERLKDYWQEKLEISEEDDSEEDKTEREKGEDIELADNLLSEDQLKEIAEEIKLEQRCRKYELSLTVLAMPWLQKGKVLKLTGTIKDGLGNSLDLSNYKFLIVNMTYRLTNREYVGTIKAIAYVSPE